MGQVVSNIAVEETDGTDIVEVEAVYDTINSYTDYLRKLVANAAIDGFTIRQDIAPEETKDRWKQRSKVPSSQIAFEQARQSHLENVFEKLYEAFLSAIETERNGRVMSIKWFGLTLRRNTILYSICVDTTERETEQEKIEDVDVFYRAEYNVAHEYARLGVELVVHVQDSRWSCDRPADLIVLLENNRVVIADNKTAS